MANGKDSEQCRLCVSFMDSGGGGRCLLHKVPLPGIGYEIVCVDYSRKANGESLSGSRFECIREGALYYYSYAVSTRCDYFADFENLDCFVTNAVLRNDDIERDELFKNGWILELPEEGASCLPSIGEDVILEFGKDKIECSIRMVERTIRSPSLRFSGRPDSSRPYSQAKRPSVICEDLGLKLVAWLNSIYDVDRALDNGGIERGLPVFAFVFVEQRKIKLRLNHLVFREVYGQSPIIGAAHKSRE